MTIKRITNRNGDTVTIHLSKTGNIFCPVCGVEFADSSNCLIDQIFFGCTEICSSCDTHFGFSDQSNKFINSKYDLETRWGTLRLAWLDNQEWSAIAIDQIWNNLEIQMSPPKAND